MIFSIPCTIFIYLIFSIYSHIGCRQEAGISFKYSNMQKLYEENNFPKKPEQSSENTSVAQLFTMAFTVKFGTHIPRHSAWTQLPALLLMAHNCWCAPCKNSRWWFAHSWLSDSTICFRVIFYFPCYNFQINPLCKKLWLLLGENILENKSQW